MKDFKYKSSNRFDLFLTKNPIFGNLTNNHIFLEAPLFESIQVNMKEPQYTTALGWFLKKDKLACFAFIKAIQKSLGIEVSDLSDEEIQTLDSHWEVQTKENKEIDNIISWREGGKSYAIVLEIKFNAELRNDLVGYAEKSNEFAENLTLIVLSKTQTNPKEWKSLLWQHFLPVLNEEINKEEKISLDFRRCLSSLWRKTLNF